MTLIDWLKNENNPALDKSEYLYGTRHIIMLVITALLCLGVYFLFRKKKESSKSVFLYVSASILLFFEIASRVITLWFMDSYTITNVIKAVLPMHMCSVMVWVFIIGIFFRNKLLLRYSAIMGLLSTLAFLLYPAVGINQQYMAFTNVYSTVSHMVGFVVAISLMSLRIIDFKFKTLWQPYLCATIMFSYGWVLNWVVFPGSDYMYMRHDPLELNLSYPYQYLYGAILVVYIFMFYFVNLFTRKKANEEVCVEKTTCLNESLEESEISNDERTKIVKTNEEVGDDTEATILKIIASNPKLSKKQIANYAKVNDNQLDKYIKNLKEVGKLERVGPGNGGYWKIKE